MAGKQTISRRMPITMPLVSLVSLKIRQFFLRMLGQGKSPLQVLPALLPVEAELRLCRPRALQEADERDTAGIEPVTENELRLVEAALPLALRMQRHGHGQVDKGGLGPSQKLGGQRVEHRADIGQIRPFPVIFQPADELAQPAAVQPRRPGRAHGRVLRQYEPPSHSRLPQAARAPASPLLHISPAKRAPRRVNKVEQSRPTM